MARGLWHAMNRAYQLHDDTVESLIGLLRNEAERAETLGDDVRAERLKADLGVLEAQYPHAGDATQHSLERLTREE